MLYYSYYQTFTQEIPDELSLGFSILGCDIHCPKCHSSHTWDVYSEGKGIPLTTDVLDTALASQYLVTCILFYGGEWDKEYLEYLLKYSTKYDKKLALYTGRELEFFYDSYILAYLDYIKVGRYDEEKGGLTSPTTNQRLYKLTNGLKEDITRKFWR